MASPTFHRVTSAASDIDTLLSFVYAYYTYDGIDFDESAVRRGVALLLEHPEYGGAWLIRDGSRSIGHFVLGYGFDLEFGGRQATLTEFFIEEGSRGSGVGRAVFAFIEATLRSEGMGALELQAETDNHEAIAFYAKMGMKHHTRIAMSKRIAQ